MKLNLVNSLIQKTVTTEGALEGQKMDEIMSVNATQNLTDTVSSLFKSQFCVLGPTNWRNLSICKCK